MNFSSEEKHEWRTADMVLVPREVVGRLTRPVIASSGDRTNVSTSDLWALADFKEPQTLSLDYYDAGLLSDHGGGNVDWWWDYLRAELGRAHDFYQAQADGASSRPPVIERESSRDERNSKPQDTNNV